MTPHEIGRGGLEGKLLMSLPGLGGIQASRTTRVSDGAEAIATSPLANRQAARVRVAARESVVLSKATLDCG